MCVYACENSSRSNNNKNNSIARHLLRLNRDDIKVSASKWKCLPSLRKSLIEHPSKKLMKIWRIFGSLQNQKIENHRLFFF